MANHYDNCEARGSWGLWALNLRKSTRLLCLLAASVWVSTSLETRAIDMSLTLCETANLNGFRL